MKHLFVIFFSFLLVSCSNLGSSVQDTSDISTVNKNADSATGYWQIPEKSRMILRKNEVFGPGAHLFYFDNKYITISLVTLKDWMWKSEDDFYKLEAKWGHDSLYYLPPFGNWTYLAKFDGNNFFTVVNDSTFTYYKVEKDQISKSDSSIIKVRSVHDYNIKPTDPKTKN